MPDWDGQGLALLAPAVDLGEARAAFVRVRARRRALRRSLVVGVAATAAAIGVVGVASSLRDDRGRVAVEAGDAPERGVWVEETTLPDLRTAPVMAVGGGRVFVWGGLQHPPGSFLPRPTTRAGEPLPERSSTGTPVVDGLVYDIARRTWESIPDAPVPALGFEAVAVWTGSELLVWGTEHAGTGPGTARSAGARYDPVRRAWRPMAAQDGVALGTGVWTGREFVVVGTSAVGANVRAMAYDPAADAWRLLDDPPLLSTMVEPFGALAWTGDAVLAADGETVALLDPAAGVWRPAAAGPFAARRGSTFVWTGSELLQVGGGVPDGDAITNEPGIAAYDPRSDSWRAVDGAPAELYRGYAYGDGAVFLSAGESWRYDRAAGTVAPFVGPPGRGVLRAVWTGDELWGLTYVGMDEPGDEYRSGTLWRSRP